MKPETTPVFHISGFLRPMLLCQLSLFIPALPLPSAMSLGCLLFLFVSVFFRQRVFESMSRTILAYTVLCEVTQYVFAIPGLTPEYGPNSVPYRVGLRQRDYAVLYLGE